MASQSVPKTDADNTEAHDQEHHPMSYQQADIWHIRLLGGMRLDHQGQTLRHFKTRRMTLLLARLACSPTHAFSRDVLAEELWPDDDPDVIRERFRQTLSLLRRELEPSGVSPGSVLITNRSTVYLNPLSFTTDIAEFKTACHAAGRESDIAKQIELFHQALALYQGELLPGFYEEWLLTERGHLAELYRQALGHLTHALINYGEFEEAVAAGRKAIASDPLREDAHCTLIRLFAQMGRSGDAQKQYEELERLLREETHSKPTAATNHLMEQVRSGVLIALPPVSVVPATLTSAVLSADQAVSSASLSSVPHSSVPHSSVPHSYVPNSLTRFFGREEEIELLKSLLTPPSLPNTSHMDTASHSSSSATFASDSCRLVTLTGHGGAGKTRLALEAARRLSPSYAEAVWFVPLADVTHPDLIPDAIIEALGLPRSAHAAPMDQILEFLQSFSAALLVLDNFEHLQERGTHFVRILRMRLPRLACLITSRHKLNLEGERDVALPPLKTPGEAETPEQLRAYPSVQLFLDRAQAARYSFVLTQDNAAAVAMLGKRLEGIPLAIELAAAWAATLSPEQILQRLSRRFDLLISRRADVPQRHRSLQAVLEGSYQQLPPKLQYLFTHLSVFRGGWTLDAAEQIAGVHATGATNKSVVKFDTIFDNLDGLALLQERSFLRAEENGAEMRYRLLESLREFGAEQLETEERAVLARRHANYYFALTAEAQTHLRTPEEKKWFDLLEAEHDNLRAALEWTIENEIHIALQMAARLGSFWMTRGFAREGSEWLQKALSLSEAEQKSQTKVISDQEAEKNVEPVDLYRWRGEALNCLALMHLLQGELDAGTERARESLAALQGSEDSIDRAKALNTLGSILMEQGKYDEAQSHYEECLRLYRAAGYKAGESIALANLGTVLYGRGEYALACRCYNECLEVRRLLGDKRGIAAALDYLARAVREQGDYQRACDLHTESLAMRRALNDKPGIAFALNHLAIVKIRIEELDEARLLLNESLQYWHEIGDKTGLAEALNQWGELCRREGETAAARAYWLESLRISREAGDRASIAESLESYAVLAESEAQYYHTAQLLGFADAIRSDISNPIRPSLLSRYEQTFATITDALGQERFQQAWMEGRALTIDQAILLTNSL